MRHDDRIQLLDALQASVSNVVSAAGHIADNLASLEPTEGRWSVLECIEHIILVEDAFLPRIASAERRREATYNRDREAYIRSELPARKIRVSAPEHACPEGRFSSVRSALDALHASEKRAEGVLEAHKNELRLLSLSHPVLGKISAYEAMLLIAAHRQRHANQILETKAALGCDIGSSSARAAAL